MIIWFYLITSHSSYFTSNNFNKTLILPTILTRALFWHLNWLFKIWQFLKKQIWNIEVCMICFRRDVFADIYRVTGDFTKYIYCILVNDFRYWRQRKHMISSETHALAECNLLILIEFWMLNTCNVISVYLKV